MAEKVRVRIAEPMTTPDGDTSITVSIGVTVSRPVDSGSAMVTRADEAMYRAKRDGRNRVVGIPAH
jgi:diguanylate cyclase (GGDEF)-like protein